MNGRKGQGSAPGLEDSVVMALAADLHRAEESRVQIQQLSRRYPGMTIDDGYRVSRAWAEIKRAEGRVVRGHKIGLTSRAMQKAVQISEPDYGTLFDDMFFSGNGDVPFDRFIEPLVEVELAFVLAKRIEGPNVTIFDVLNATDYIVPALELIDARIERIDRTTQSRRRVQDSIADNAANAGIIVGGRPVRPDAVDPRWIGALLRRNGVIEESGLAAGVLNHPAEGVAWLANRLSDWDEYLEEGEVVLGGSFTRPVSAQKGDDFHADYGPLGSIAFHFA